MPSPEQPAVALRNLGPVLLLVGLLVGAGAYSGRASETPAAEALPEPPATRDEPAIAPQSTRPAGDTPTPLEPDSEAVDMGATLTDEVLDALDCEMPRVPIDETSGCARSLSYPACKWRVPPPARADNLYRIWRNTEERHLRGRPALVSLILTAATEYVRLFPGEVLAIGDLDAPGPRHMTHRRGVDVDLYLPGMMEVENRGGGEYAGNYGTLSGL